MSLTARLLEEAGLPTVIIGSARDIVEECAVPRFVFTDLPLGNPCGPPGDRSAQAIVVTLAVQLLATATAGQTTVRAPVQWRDDHWRATYMAVGDETPGD